jgi:dienelactone hydrolase
MSIVITYRPGITADWYEPTAITYPVAVVSYGTEGMNSPFGKLIDDYCLELCKADIAVIRPNFFEATNATPGIQGVFQSGPPGRFDAWVEAIKDAAKYALGLPKTNGKLAFVGFSLGSNLALRAASDFAPKPSAVIDFFGPIESISQSVISSVMAAKLPPVQIHHGDKDGIVRFLESVELESWLKVAGVTCEFDHTAYLGSGHPGQKRAREFVPQLPDADWSLADQQKSFSSSVAFLKNYL